MIKIFISYSWDSENHKQWVKKLADDLDSYHEFHVKFDVYDLDNFADKNHFMEEGVFDSDFILVIATESYATKANERLGGVGIETSLASARHWEEFVESRKSKVLVVKKDKKQCIPNYLKSKIYLDFSEDKDYYVSLKCLIEKITGDSQSLRPVKTKTISDKVKYYSFSRVEDILKINYKKRKPIISGAEGTDYSGNNKIKFEFWEVITPKKQNILVLFENINISQTVKRFVQLAAKKMVVPKEITVLRPTRGDAGYISTLLKGCGLKNIEVDEITFSDFIWDFCIDEQLKNKLDVFQEPFFIDQELLSVDEDEVSTSHGAASTFLIKEINSEKCSPAHLVLASGGTGKSTLCQRIVNEVNNVDRQIAVFVQSENIKQLSLKESIQSASIRSVFDLCNLYWKLIGSSDIYDKETFELSVLCGNIVVIIDGLDEFISIFQENFDLERFISSILELNSQLGKSKIILTSRCHVLEEVDLSHKQDLKVYNLRGFDESACDKYILRRFSKYTVKVPYVDKVTKLIYDLIISSSDKRVLPFLVDLICTLVENHKGTMDSFSFRMSLQGKEYRSNEDLVDSIVYSTFRREKERQNIEIPITEQIQIFQELSAEYGDIIPKSKVEEHIRIYYEDKAPGLLKQILVNPLLIVREDLIKFRYNFLSDYFLVLFLLETFRSGRVDSVTLMTLSKMSIGEGQVFKDVVKYFIQNQTDAVHNFKTIIEKLHDAQASERSQQKEEIIWKDISAVLQIVGKSIGASMTKTDLTQCLKEICSANELGKGRFRLQRIAIYGEFPPLDFCGIEIWESRFVKYSNFVYSKFDSTSKFVYCYFDGIYSTSVPDSFSTSMFDETCRLGDLVDVINTANSSKSTDMDKLEIETKKFLRRFLENGRFKNRELSHIKLHTTDKGINDNLLNGLIRDSILVVDTYKTNAYGLSKTYEKSVYNFIINNIVDHNIGEIIERITLNR